MAAALSDDGAKPRVTGSTHTSPVKVSAGPLAVDGLEAYSMICSFLGMPIDSSRVTGPLGSRLSAQNRVMSGEPQAGAGKCAVCLLHVVPSILDWRERMARASLW